MNKTLEDNLGKLAMLLIFGFMFYQQATSFIISFQLKDQISLWPLALFSQLCGATFLAFVLYFTSTRLPPKDSAAGISPRIFAFAGTFFMISLIVAPPEDIEVGMRIVSTCIVIVGTLLSIACLTQLGKSFSMMASSRELRTKGAYGIARHPLYAAELVMIFGIVLGHGTFFAFAVGAVWFALQVRRAYYEEGVLRTTFPEYDDYSLRVPMLVPGFRFPNAMAA